MLKRVLIANRGEIALRVLRACRELGIETVAAYSQADAEALPVQLATQSVCIGPARAADSYLNENALLSAALATGCDSLHPGYGFLSENADFADACRENGITFIGPSGDSIRRAGSKSAARELMRVAGVPVTPGSDGPVNSVEDALAAAERVGYPVLLKASAGGGGRGIRRCDSADTLPDAYAAARGVRVLHYINSSGLKEMIEGTPIASEFRKIYACSFLYDVDGIAYWPAVAVNYTNKTQFIFKINKGVESVSDCKLVNQYIEERERPVPFSRMIYVGDGTTDIPCMRLVKNFGGHSIAVYNPASAKVGRKDLASLIRDNRVNHVCAADYTEGSEIDRLVKLIIDKIAVDFELQQLEIPR